MFRSHRVTRTLALASGLAFLLTATVTSAGPNDRRQERRHRVVYHDDYSYARSDDRHDRHRSHRSHRSDFRHDRRRSHRSDFRRDHHRGYRSHDRYERRHEIYTCGPCGHRFQSRRRFDHHLSRYHHVPLFALPFVSVRHSLGWIFHG